MTTHHNLEPGDTAQRIVSVNDVGGASQSIWRKLTWLVVAGALAVVGVLMSVNRYRAHARASDQKTAQAEQVANTSLSTRRVFSTTPPVPLTPVPAQPPSPSLQACDDHYPSEPMAGLNGMPVLTPMGQPVRICRNGQLLLPPLPAGSAPPAAIQLAPTVPSQPSSTQATPAASSSRYGGDVLLPSESDAGHAVPVAVLRDSPASPQLADQDALAAGAAERPTAPAEDRRGPPQGSLQSALRAASPTAVQASMLGDRDMILPQGRSIDCNLSLRVVSDVSGMAVCVLSSYVYGDSGVVALAEPGSVATGDYIAIAAQGQRRLFIVWSRLKTSKGVVVNLNSPAADALGTSGLDGYVDNRWPERIGAAVLLSSVQDVIGYETARAGNHGNGNGATGIAVFPQLTQTGSKLAERLLESTINIKPTIYKHQGDRATISVARDLDFGSVYVLRRQ